MGNAGFISSTVATTCVEGMGSVVAQTKALPSITSVHGKELLALTLKGLIFVRLLGPKTLLSKAPGLKRC